MKLHLNQLWKAGKKALPGDKVTPQKPGRANENAKRLRKGLSH